jgi:hypothetical protein
MKKEIKKNDILDDELKDEYDFSGGVRGKYASKLIGEQGFIKLEPDILKIFHSSEDVNNILRSIIHALPTPNKRTKVVQ